MASDRTTMREPSAGQRRSPGPTTSPRSPQPAAPTKAQALHQRVGNQGAQTLMQNKATAPASAAKKEPVILPTISSETVDIASGVFNPSEKVKGEIESLRGKPLLTKVIAKGVAEEGRVEVWGSKGKFYSKGKGSMPLLNTWMQGLSLNYLNVSISNNKVVGEASRSPAKEKSETNWLKILHEKSQLLGGPGLEIKKFPKAVNKFDGGKLTLEVKDLGVEVGGFLDAKFSVLVENANNPEIHATAGIKIKGIVEGKDITLDYVDGHLTGQASLEIAYKSFNGSAVIKYLPDGTIDVQGRAAYDSDKLSGEIQFVVTDEQTADNFAKDAIAAAGGLDNIQNAPPPAPVPAPKKKDRALAATGQLNFNLTKWFAGTVNVVVDGKGYVTVIGKIAPPAKIPLFPQRNWDKQLFKFEVTASYGIPVLGSLDLFANISLHAIAKLGPAIIDKIEVLGTYSTNPEKRKEIRISGSVNISAYAGLRLRAEGGAGITLARHRLKFGIGINVDVGVQAYAEARPTIGYREPGEFYISGTLEMVAQPVLGLNGEFFIELDAPWWSPVDDDRWAWPLFSKEWPLGDPIGINAVVKEYVLGSGQVPEITLQEPKFDPSKFMTSMVDDNLPGKSGAQGKGQGTFKDDGSVPKPVVPPKKPLPPKRGEKPAKKGAPQIGTKGGKKDKKGKADPAAVASLETGLNALKNKQPYSKPELDKALGTLKGRTGGPGFQARLVGDKWIVTPTNTGNKKQQGQVELTAKKGSATADNAQKGIAALGQVAAGYAGKGATFEEISVAINSVRRKFKFKSLLVERKGRFWVFNYEINPKDAMQGPAVLDVKGTDLPVAVGDKIRRKEPEGWSNGRVTRIADVEERGQKVKLVYALLVQPQTAKAGDAKPPQERLRTVTLEKLISHFGTSPESLPVNGYARGHSEDSSKPGETKGEKETEWSPVKVNETIKTRTSHRIEKILVIRAESITYSQTDSKEASPVTRSRVEFLRDWHAIPPKILRADMKSAEELRAELTRLYGSAVAERIMKRTELAKNMKILDASEAHHIIPVEIWGKIEVLRRLIESGWDPNEAANGIALSEGFHGNHPAYSAYVSKMITDRVVSNPKMTLPEFKAYLMIHLKEELLSLIAKAKAASVKTNESLNDYFSKL